MIELDSERAETSFVPSGAEPENESTARRRRLLRCTQGGLARRDSGNLT
jgi:hypothetical protein